MTEAHATTDGSMTLAKRALVEIRELRSRLADAESRLGEPIAIVGMALRFPGGVRDAAGFAELLWSARDAVHEIPADRWPISDWFDADRDAPGKMTTRFGAFIDQVDMFDAAFFGISPREAASMDPQQRLLLEVAWEALENAGQAPGNLVGTRAGVYVGIANNDYGRELFARPELIDLHFSTGNAYSIAAGRLSYFLGLHGPAIAVDTACSSSLVAMHLACQGLRLRECDLALVGGVNLILTPEMNINFSKAGMMAADGRCKTFDAAADGYVRGEGCAVLVLRRLRDAVANGDRILAVVRGSAINQDGRSGGLTAPNGPAQEAVIRAALDAAQVSGEDITYVETHGTGTPLGDPIEVGALGAVLCKKRDPRNLLFIGSVKTNIGHLESAAGVAGVVKVILAFQRREVPAHLHFHEGNPHIDWDALPIKVPIAPTPWRSVGDRRLAGVSSFGFSGTNAHVILEEPPPALDAPQVVAERPLHILALSARDVSALPELCERYEAAIVGGTPVADACFTANAGRTHFESRLAVIGRTADELREGLRAHVAGRSTPAVATGQVLGSARPQVAFLFTGQGAQYAGMGRRLYETSPAFRAALDACATGLEPHMERGLLDIMFATENATAINDAAYIQPATFAIEYALAELWRSWGVEPAAVLGHSLGEYVAACVAGVLPLADALRLVNDRARLTSTLAPDGGMAAVFASQPAVEAVLGDFGDELSIAAYNGPEHVVISGRRNALDAALKQFEATGVRVRPLRIPHAAHTRFVDPIMADYERVLTPVRFGTLQLPLVSNVTGKLVGADELCRPDYWLAHMRQPVRFESSMRALQAQGISHFVEVGPHPVLLGMGAECILDQGARWLPSLHRERTDWSDLLESLQRLYVDGVDVDWSGFDKGYRRRRIELPTYPFRRRRHWIDVGRDRGSQPDHTSERWSRVQTSLNRQQERGPLDLNASTYPAKWDCLARLTSAHAVRVLAEAGLFARAGEQRTLEEILEVAGIKPVYQRLVRRWLDRLVLDGLLHAEGPNYLARTPLPDPDLPALWVEAEQLLADNQQLRAYVRHCGELLGDVLRGKESPLETLFPGGSFALAEDLYERSATMRFINALAATAIEALADTTSTSGHVRVLEVGAGTGGTTAALVPVLPPQRTKYCFTDVSDVFLARGQERFSAVPFMTYKRFSLDEDPTAQGFVPASFDVIVSANAVHASIDLRLALRRLRELLAPGGILVLVESTTHFAWFDMTTGLIEGWQHFSDDLRSDDPLLSPQAWVEALTRAGFEQAGAWPRSESAGDRLGQHVLVARVAGEPSSAFAEQGAVEGAMEARAFAVKEEVAAFRQAVLEALPSERMDLMRDFVRERVSHVLRLDEADAPGRHDRLMDLGMDSLMAVQLRNSLGRDLALEKPLPASLMFDYPTVETLATYLLDCVVGPPPVDGAAKHDEDERRHSVFGQEAVAAMSDKEIEALLLERLAR